MALPKPEYQEYRKYYQSLDKTIQKPKVRLYTTAVLSFLAISLFAWYAIRPTLTTILFLRREIADKTIVNQKMEEKINALIEAQANYQAVNQKLTLINEAIPTSTNLISLLSQLKNLNSSANASLSALRVPAIALNENIQGETTTVIVPTPAPDQSPIIAIEKQPEPTPIATGKLVDFPVTMLIAGDYATLKTVLDSLISMRRLVTMTSLHIDSTQKLGKTNLLQLDLKLNGYFYQTKNILQK